MKKTNETKSWSHLLTEKDLASIRKRLPFRGIKHISEKTGFSRSTVNDCLKNQRGNRRIDSDVIIKEAVNLIEGK